MYAATKHAVKGYTDALRVEIELVDKAPVSITLIQPTAVDTPFPQHARNFTDKEPMLPKPMIEPQQVADAILHAAEHPTRDKAVGAMSLLNTTMAQGHPRPGRQDGRQARRQAALRRAPAQPGRRLAPPQRGNAGRRADPRDRGQGTEVTGRPLGRFPREHDGY